jgi:hypothetical protein
MPLLLDLELELLPPFSLLDPSDGGGRLPLGLDGGDEPVEELDGLVWVTAGHLSLLGMIEPSGHNFFLPFRLDGLF